MPRASVEPITEKDLQEFCEFLTKNLSSSRSPAGWQEALQANWTAARPNYGFMLKDKGAIVGGIGAIYADRDTDGRQLTTCNITSWCVLDAYRALSMKLAMSVVGQPGLHFTDFSPTEVVSSSLQFLKFRALDSRQVILPNLPGIAAGARAYMDRRDIETRLTGSARKIFEDHARFPWLRHALVEAGGAQCHVIYKIDKVKGFGAARILYIGNRQVFQRAFRVLSRKLLMRGLLFTKAEVRQLGELPRFHSIREGFIRKVYFSDIWKDADVDYLYSESVCMDL
jgi:hypothetical protein